jgi:LuxR family transcriptional regulator, maltose regulon positive regulatory protein
MQLIAEKISIPQERPPLSRARLIELLSRSTEMYSTTIISGRTGTGKTLLAADFARHCGRRVAWYSVDATDKDPHFFFGYLLESLRRVRPDLEFPYLATLAEQFTESDLEQLAEAIIYELQETESAESLLIVIDDLHLIYDESWVLPFFRRFIPLLPSDIHLLILARSVIPVPLWRMRSKQNLLTIDEGWLAFTHEEASWLFATRGLGEKQALEALQLSRGRAALVDEIAKQMSEEELYAEVGNYSVQPWQQLSAA